MENSRLQYHSVHPYVCVWEWKSVVMKAELAALDEHITYIQRIFQTLPIVKFSITWVNRGQWEKNKYPHLSQRCSLFSFVSAHTQIHTHIWADLAVSSSDCLLGSLTHHDKCPFFAKNHFPRHVRYGDINECTMTVLREASSYPASANLSAGHFCKTGKRNYGNKQVRVRNSSPLPD